MAESGMSTLHFQVRELSDEAWLDLLLRSLNSREVEGISLPGFPMDQIRPIPNISPGEKGLRSANKFYLAAREMMARYATPLSTDSRILDFGCGWGRISRFFYRDVDEKNIFGVDVSSKLIEACEKAKLPGRFDVIEPMGAVPHPDAQFDMVFTNSVFSHLNEPLHQHAIAEIVRVLKPGGVAINTIIDEDKLAKWRQSNGEIRDWARRVLGDFDDVAARLARGEIVWGETGRVGVLDGYGLAVVPLSYARQWPNLEYRGVRFDYAQTMVLSQKTE